MLRFQDTMTILRESRASLCVCFVFKPTRLVETERKLLHFVGGTGVFKLSSHGVDVSALGTD